MTADEAIAEVDKRSAGRTRYDGCPEYLDEVLVEEIRRLRAQCEALVAALQFAHDIADEELPNTRVGTGAEVALRHIKRKTGEALRAVGIMENKT